MKKNITQVMLEEFQTQLKAEEKSTNTITKYLRDVKKFLVFLEENKEITKELVISYKQYLKDCYMLSSANSMLASINSFFKWAGWFDCVVKPFKVQHESFRAADRELSREEYIRLTKVAQEKGQTWLYLIMVTLCSTGIRISELSFITVQSLSTHQARIVNKGKVRKVILPAELCRKLRQYAKKRGITSGSIFVTRNGKPIDRSNVHHAMKKLCKEANVQQGKVFPHNLRHLFAVQHYGENHDLSGLASILGHSNINTTRIYTMVTLEEKEAEINALGLVV